MPANPFEAKVRQLPGVAVIDLSGEMDASGEAVLDAAYMQVDRADSPVVLLNFRGIDYINSTGIALIVGLLGRAREKDRRILACGLNDHYREMFVVTRLADFVSIFPDEASVLAKMSTAASDAPATAATTL